jgi:hypothetical protein
MRAIVANSLWSKAAAVGDSLATFATTLVPLHVAK